MHKSSFSNSFETYLWASSRKPRPTVLIQGRQIFLDYSSYMIVMRFLRILAQVVSKNIDPLRLYEHFIWSPKIDYIHQWGS